MALYVMGVDFGSTTGKAVILNGAGEVIGSSIASKGSVSDEGVQTAIGEALARANIAVGELARTVSTGYGRRMLEVADASYTEITCHARGAVAMVPGARLVIDIGGQDSKVIAVDDSGLVSQFAMNDRCAAGTGKFLETLARAVRVPLDEMGPSAMTSAQDLKISSMCATFAETEVIALLAEGHAKPDVLGAVHAAIASRTVGLVSRVGLRTPVVMTGGVARNVAAVHHIEKALGVKLIIPAHPQTAGAFGAALIALDEACSARAAPDAAPELEIASGPVSCTAPRRTRVQGEQELLRMHPKLPGN